MPTNKIDEIEEFLSQDIETLYEILDLLSSSEKNIRYSPGNEKDRGKDYFEDIISSLNKKICNEWEFCKKRNDPDFQDTVNLISTVADVIASMSIGVPPVLVSTILFKKGLVKFCKCEK